MYHLNPFPIYPQCHSEDISVCELPHDSTEEEIREVFERYGTVAAVQLLLNPEDGFLEASVKFAEPRTVDDVLKGEFHAIKGKKVAVKKAASKQGKIYVGKFTTLVPEEDIKAHFGQYGTVVEVQRPVDRSKNNEPKNFCFVTFEKEETANNLLKKGSENVGGQDVELKKVTLKNDQGGMRGGRGGMGRGGMGRGQGGWGGGYDQGGWGGYGGGGWGDYGAWGGYGGGWGGAGAGGWGGYGGGGGGGGKMGMGGGYQRGGRGGRGGGGRAAPY